MSEAVLKKEDGTKELRTLARYHPFKDEWAAGIVTEFANIRGTPGALAFVNKFGPLTWDGRSKDGEPTRSILKRSKQAHRLLLLAAEAAREADGEATLEGAADLTGILEDADDRWEVTDLWPSLRYRVIPPDQRSSKPRLIITPPDLLSAIMFAIGKKLADGATFRECRRCGTLFEAGRGGQRKKSARFCSPDHQIEFNSLKRTTED
jgi:hypothetical protein